MESHEMLKALKSANRVTEFHHVHVVQYALENILIYTIQYAEIIIWDNLIFDRVRTIKSLKWGTQNSLQK